MNLSDSEITGQIQIYKDLNEILTTYTQSIHK